MRFFALLTFTAAVHSLSAQPSTKPSRTDSLKAGAQFDTDGEYAKARIIFQQLIGDAPNAALKAEAQHALAISYAFTGECASAAILEEKIIDYWRTHEQDRPQEAFFQEGESSREAGNICYNAGDFVSAERNFHRAAALGLREPEPRRHSSNLWTFRLAFDLAMTNAADGDRENANRRYAEAQKILAGDQQLAKQEGKFMPFLDALIAQSRRENTEFLFKKAIAMKADQDTVYAYYFLALGWTPQKPEYGNRQECARAFARATAHDVASAYVRPRAKACMLGRRPIFPK